jgi:hypothetical protein
MPWNGGGRGVRADSSPNSSSSETSSVHVPSLVESDEKIFGVVPGVTTVRHSFTLTKLVKKISRSFFRTNVKQFRCECSFSNTCVCRIQKRVHVWRNRRSFEIFTMVVILETLRTKHKEVILLCQTGALFGLVARFMCMYGRRVSLLMTLSPSHFLVSSQLFLPPVHD